MCHVVSMMASLTKPYDNQWKKIIRVVHLRIIVIANFARFSFDLSTVSVDVRITSAVCTIPLLWTHSV